jgi:hypothetical protein
MVNLKRLTFQMELSFWTFIIPLLSESQFLHRVVPAVYGFFQRDRLGPVLRLTALFSLVGFLAGLIMGVITVYTM